jgi:acyl carrier protein
MSLEVGSTAVDPQVVEKLLAIISKEGMVPREKLARNAELGTLGVESADVIVILLAIEEQFGVYIPVDSQISEMQTVGDLVDALAKHIAAKPAQN